MTQRFSGNTVLVTGGGSGIGKAIAHAFVEEGANVFIVGRRREALEMSQREASDNKSRMHPVSVDVRRTEDVMGLMDQIRSEHGGLDILINAAGVLHAAEVHLTRETDFDEMFSTNVKGLWLVSKHAVPLMKGRTNANIIHLSSAAGLRSEVGLGVYEASKAAVNTLTKVMAKELSKEKIRVNAIAPGPVNTELYKGSVYGDDERPSSKDEIKVDDVLPFGRLGTPDEVAKLALFLASPESDFMSGTITPIEGSVGY